MNLTSLIEPLGMFPRLDLSNRESPSKGLNLPSVLSCGESVACRMTTGWPVDSSWPMCLKQTLERTAPDMHCTLSA
jgi:hypothetical protein